MGTPPHIWFLLTLAISSGGFSAVAGDCNHQCSPQSSVFQYQKGHTYTYSFEGTTLTSLPGTQGEPVRLKLKATADLSVADECNRVLRLRGVTINGPDSKNYANLKDLEAHPVLANFKGNSINKQLCSEEGDNQSSLNIKRAILSLLQIPNTKSSSASEVDVFGICSTNVRHSQRGDVTVISKSRNLNRCASRENLIQEILSTRFTGQSDLHATPLLDADLHVEQHIKGGLIVSATSRESYLFRPFSNQGNGAKTTVETKLTLTTHNAQPAPPLASFKVPKSIVFEAPHALESVPGGSSAITAALHAAESSTKDGVTVDAAAKFRTLVSVLRQSSSADILKVYNDVKAGAGFSNKRAARNLLLDALFRTSTGDAVEVIALLLKSKEITTNHWYRGLAFIQHASLKSVVSISSLLDQKNLPTEAFLGIGSFIGRYCREHKCENVAEFDEVLSKFSKHVSASVTSKAGENRVIAALKALGNIRHLNNALGEKVKQLALDKSLRPRVRVAALEVIQNDPCRKNLKQAALQILRDHVEDSELRIKAYLAVVECPCDNVVKAISNLLDNEPIIQVGSFVVSHLKNLQASTDPSKAEAKEKLGQLKAKKTFSSDIRRYSQNYELSYAIDALNAGASVESNVIFSQSSYLPRSVSLNLTADIFGHSYNVFEIAARTENLDHVIESYLGPKGYIESEDDDEIVDKFQEKYKTLASRISERFEKTFRQKRSVSKDAVENIRQQAYNSLLPSQKDRSLDLDLSLKTFGSELAWFNYDGKHEQKSSEHVVDEVFDTINEGLQKSKKFNYDFEPHFTFLDSELSYPTNLGFPLKLAIDGSIAARLKLNGEVDVRSILRQPENAAFRLEFVPSAAVELTGKLLVDAYVVEGGLKLDYNVHSSTGINVAVHNLNDLGIDIKVGLPVKKQDIIDVKTDVLTTVKERGHPETSTPLHFNLQGNDYKQYRGCFDQLSPVSGLTFCGNVSVPWVSPAHAAAFYPLNGPSHLSVSIEADDVSEYHFRAELKKDGSAFKSAEVLFDTPGSGADRKVLLLVERKEKPHQGVTATLKSAWKEVVAEGLLIDDNNEKSVSAKLVIDADEYSVKGGVKISGNPNRQVYRPVLEYKAPSKENNAKVKKAHKTPEGITVDGAIVVERDYGKNKYTFQDLALKTPKGTYAINGYLDINPRNYAFDLKLSVDKNELNVNGHLNYAEPRSIDIALEVTSPQYPDYGYGFQLINKRGDDSSDSKIILASGRDLKSDGSRIIIEHFIKGKYETLDKFNLETSGKVIGTGHEILGKFEISSKPRHLEYDLKLGYDALELSSSLVAKRDIKAPDDYELKFSAKILDNSIRIESSREVKPKDDSVFLNTLIVLSGKKYELQVDIKSATEDEYHTSLKAESTLKIEGKTSVRLITEFTTDAQAINAHVKLSSEGEDSFEIVYKLNRGSGNPSGNAKLFVKNYLDGTVTFKYNNGVGTGTLQIDVPKLHRKIKATGDLTLSGSQRSAAIDLYWDADRDQSKQLHFKTENDVKEKSIDSKNTLRLLDQLTTLNFKGSLSGAIDDGKLEGQGELILPTGRYLGFKFGRALHLTQADTKLGLHLQAEDRESASSSQPKWKTDFLLESGLTRDSFQGEAKFLFETEGKHDLKLFLSGKLLPQGEKKLISGQFSGQGSVLGGRTSVIKLNSEIDETFITYNLNSECSQGYRANIVGKINRGYSPVAVKQIENTVELLLPFDKLKQLKHTIIGTFSSQPESAPEFTVSNVLIWNNENTLKLIGEAAGDEKEGRTKWDLILPKEEPRTLETTWSNAGDNKKAGSLSFKWGNNKEAKVSTDIEFTPDNQPHILHLKATSPTEKFGNLDVALSVEKNANPADKIDFEVTVIADQKKTDVKGSLGFAPGVPIIDIVAVQPSGTSKIFVDFLRKSDSELHGAIELQWVSFGGGYLTANGDIKLDIDDFYLKLDIDSPKFNFNKWHLEAGQRAAKGSKRIVFTAKSAEKVVFSGSTNFHSKAENHKISYSGNGQVRIGDKGHNFNFRSSRQNLLQESDKEIGVEYNLEFEVAGRGSLHNKLKVSNKEFHALGRQCSEGKPNCAVIEIQSKVSVSDAKETTHDLVLLVDLKSVGVDTGIALTAETVRRGFWFIDEQVSLTLSHNGDTTYKYKAYVKETGGGFTVTLPSRVIAAEVKVAPDVKPNHWKQQISASVWLDKTRLPNSFSSLILLLEEVEDKGTDKYVGQLRFTHPNLEKDLTVKGYIQLGSEDKLFDSNLEVDIFKQKNQKISVSSHIVKQKQNDGLKLLSSFDVKSKGHELDVTGRGEATILTKSVTLHSVLKYKKDKRIKESEFQFEASSEKLLVHAKVPNHHLLHIDASTKRSNKHAAVDASVHIIGLPTSVIHFEGENKGFPVVKGTVSSEGTPNKKLELIADLSDGVHVEADYISESGKKELFYTFLSARKDNRKPEFRWSVENIQSVLEPHKNDIKEVLNKAKEISQEAGNEITKEVTRLTESLKGGLPNFGRFVNTYETQINALKNEITNDKVLKEISENWREIIGDATEVVTTLVNGIIVTIDALLKTFNELAESILDALKKSLPALQEAYNQLVEGIVETTQTLAQTIVDILSSVAEILKKHEADIREYLSLLADLANDVGKFVTKITDVIYEGVIEFSKPIVEQIEGLHFGAAIGFSKTLEQLQNLVVPQELLVFVQDIVSELKQSTLTPEIHDLLEAIEKYIEKVSTNKDADTEKELKVIFEKAVDAVESLIDFVVSEITGGEHTKDLYDFNIPAALPSFIQLPRVFSVRFSPFIYLVSNGVPCLSELIASYRPSLDIDKLIPPYDATAILLNSHHFFTFDRRHLTFKGICSYILAQDAQDGNFTIIANIEGGSLKSIIVSDHATTYELASDKSLLVNGRPTEYPADEGDFHAWREYNRVGIQNKAGVKVTCETSIELCTFEINGFYFGKTRGLLGTINNEPWDDFTKPDGQVAKQANEFGNAWKVNTQCADVDGVDHHEHNIKIEECEEVFSKASLLSPCFLFVDPAPYLEACNHIAHEATTKEEKELAACRTAAAYVKACSVENLFVSVPTHCVHCSVNGDAAIDIGQSFSVKVPQKSADILIVLEQVTGNAETVKDFVSPIVSQLTQELGSRGISDVWISLIGYGAPGQEYPHLYTSAGGKFSYDGKQKNIEFGERKVLGPIPLESFIDTLDWLDEFTDQAFHFLTTAETILDYPFRPGAAKSIIYVLDTSCETTTLLKHLQLPVKALKLKDSIGSPGIVLHLVTNVDNVQNKHIVGFDANHAYYNQEGKKRQVTEVSGSAKAALKIPETACSQIALATSGTVFNKNNLKQAKKFVAQHIADSLTNVELTQDCKCLPVDEGIHTRAVCAVTGAREKEHLSVKGVKGTKGVKG
ncbi:apolipophorins isoform X1 [Schistocerca piceifrons]|uniref:apolipophorins isoform X1 n=1 Tax=Schistocerca piceifrons TaxID=274613 RepID=UPI001F5FE11E|nr:apolipophorins isoform X1 [Schistocerca piceifrons]